MVGVGIDVGKESLVVAVHDPAWEGTFENTPAGHKALLKVLKKRAKGCRVVLEPTATYHLAIANCLHKAGVPIMVVNPRLTKNFAKARNQRGKSDRADSKMLAAYAVVMAFIPWTPPRAAVLQLRDLQRRRAQLVRTRTREKTRLVELKAVGGAPDLIEDLQLSIDFHKQRILAMEKAMAAVVSSDPELAAWSARLKTIPGVADVTAMSVMAEVAYLPADVDAKQLTALAGLDPKPHQSGAMDARRSISKAGNKYLRTTLYLAAWNASTFSPHVKAYRDALVLRGKPANVAYVATARRLLLAMRGMQATETDWSGQRFFAIPEPNLA
jgi:transposase